MPTVTMAPANQDAWIASLLAAIMTMLFAIPMLIMQTRFKEKSFNEIFEIILGKFFGKTISIYYMVYLLIVVLLTMIFLADFLSSAILVKT